MDAQGRPTTDAAEALKGTMAPMADAKGAALALMVELLAGALDELDVPVPGDVDRVGPFHEAADRSVVVGVDVLLGPVGRGPLLGVGTGCDAQRDGRAEPEHLAKDSIEHGYLPFNN